MHATRKGKSAHQPCSVIMGINLSALFLLTPLPKDKKLLLDKSSGVPDWGHYPQEEPAPSTLTVSLKGPPDKQWLHQHPPKAVTMVKTAEHHTELPGPDSKCVCAGILIPISLDCVIVFSSSIQYRWSLQHTEWAVVVLSLGANGMISSRGRWPNHSGLKHFSYIYIPLKCPIMADFPLIEDIPERWTEIVIAQFYLKIWIWDWSLWP